MAMTALDRRRPARAARPRRVTILGSTGSVGQSTVDLLLRNRDDFAVEALTANRNAASLAEQARALGARFAAIADPADYPALKEALAGSGIEAACGREALVEAAERPADWVMAGIVGAAGLAPTLAAVRRGADRRLRQQGGAGLRRQPRSCRRSPRTARRCCRSTASTTRSGSASISTASRRSRRSS